jgi:hypothetical protein
MPEQTDHPELNTLASALASLSPSAGRLDRDQLLFRAGQASARRPNWPWPTASALLLVLAAGLGIVAFRQGQPVITERVVYVQPEPAASLQVADRTAPAGSEELRAPASDALPSSPLSYYRLEQLASRWGVEGLPDPQMERSEQLETRITRPRDLSAINELSTQ